MKKSTKRIISLLIAVFIIANSIFGTSFSVFAEDLPTAKMTAFINDSRWKAGTSWPGGQTPKYGSSGYWGCAAYCQDYASYCYGKSARGGQRFTNISQVRAGDVIIIGNGGDGTGHWFVVLKRDGNRLYVAEGSYSSKVRIGWNYTISGNRFAPDSRTFTEGYHFLAEQCSHSWDSGSITTKPTCTSTGVKTFTCTKCRATRTESVAAAGHTTVVVDAVKATCTEDGRTEYAYCSVCSAVILNAERIPATGHKWDDGVITQRPTSTTLGVISYTCQYCGTVIPDYFADPIIISKNPVDITKVSGSGNAVFSVSAIGTGLKYQWYWRKNSSSVWAAYGTQGSDKSSLSIEAITARNGYQYMCEVQDVLGNVVYTNTASLTVVETVKIKTQPVSISTVNGSGNAVFSVAATGTGLKYQWYWRKNSSSAWGASGSTGSKTANLSIEAASARNGFQYYCEITDVLGNKVKTNVVTLTVSKGPTITKQPVSATVTDGAGQVVFAVSATGSNLTYQWYWRKNTTSAWLAYGTSGNYKTSVAIDAIRARDGFQYRCDITDRYGNKVTSSIATLRVNPALVTGITLSKTTLTLNLDGTKSATLTATVAPQNATIKDVKWTSSNTAVATVSSTGVVKAVGLGTCTITASATDGSNVKKTCNVTVATASSITYRTHVQTYGWQTWKKDGEMSGTSGESKRLEGIELYLNNQKYSGGVRYKTHVQTYGWQGWKYDGAMSGTSGESKRLEAISIELYGEMANKYDIYYRVHCQTYGWLAWAKNGEYSGSAGMSKRLEGIQVVIVPKGSPAPSVTYKGITAANSKAYLQN